MPPHRPYLRLRMLSYFYVMHDVSEFIYFFFLFLFLI